MKAAGKSLVIVESPTKAKTIANFLPPGFVVESSIGHIRDLPSSADEIPESVKGQPWARLGINVERDFEPLYIVPPEKKKQVSKLKALLKDASTLYLATDEDREGESISWHLLQVLGSKVPRKRLVFHEITREAIEKALENPRDIDLNLVEAQETRRKLDRLYGYEVSPVLWRKIAPRLSAGRVQSVAIRILVEREEERRAFVRAAYWDLVGKFLTRDQRPLEATLVSLGGKRLATGKDFEGTTGKLRPGVEKDVVLVTEPLARDLTARLKTVPWKAIKVERKPYADRPKPPFTTSTLAQEANRKLRLSSRDTMRAAQRLYENGFITYMRTDSTTLSEQAVRHARALISELYGENYLSPAPRQYQTKVKNAQEAHEAIRPSGNFNKPEDIRTQIGETEFRLYDMIWKRTMACQMAEARGHLITVQAQGGDAVFQANGKTIEFPGFLRAYVEGADDPEEELEDQERILPPVAVGDPLDCSSLDAKSHSTKPPDRFTEASLIKELEANGIGRPSTYASIIDTILRREYVVKQQNALIPTFMAFAVVGFLKKNFRDLVDIQFTARMEDDLDAISLGDMQALPYLKSFYFGNDAKAGLQHLIQCDVDPRESSTIPLGTDASGQAVNVRIGKYGPYIERGEERASIPADLAPDELTIARAETLLSQGAVGPLGQDPDTGRNVYVKVGRFGPYVQLGDADQEEKPKMVTLLPGMTPEKTTLEDALKLLKLPRNLGTDPETGQEVFVHLGRFGPYAKRGDDTRSLAKTDSIFEVTLERVLALLKEEKKASWRSRGPTVLRELGAHPESKVIVKLLDGRYGPYVSDGETNASIPKGADAATFTLDQAVVLLKERALQGPSKKKSRRPARKTPAKKSSLTSPQAKKSSARKKSPKRSREKEV